MTVELFYSHRVFQYSTIGRDCLISVAVLLKLMGALVKVSRDCHR